MRKAMAIGAVAGIQLAGAQLIPINAGASPAVPAAAAAPALATCTVAPQNIEVFISGTRSGSPGTYTNTTNFRTFQFSRSGGDGQSADYRLAAYSSQGLIWYQWTLGSGGNSFSGIVESGQITNANINSHYFNYKRSCS